MDLLIILYQMKKNYQNVINNLTTSFKDYYH